MLRRLPPDHQDPAKRGKLQFMYTTLFEVKLEELVKGGEQTARLIGEAADKCTQVRAYAAPAFCSNFQCRLRVEAEIYCGVCVGVPVYALT